MGILALYADDVVGGAGDFDRPRIAGVSDVGSGGRGLHPDGDEEAVGGAVAGEDAHCQAVIDIFCAMLGSIAGNLALTLGARGGVG